MKINQLNPDHYNLCKINDLRWKYKLTVTTSLRSKHVNHFGENKLCGYFAKAIMKHQRSKNNFPLGFVSFEYTKSDNLHFHSIWSELINVDEIIKHFEKKNVIVINNYDGISNSGFGYRVIDNQIAKYIPKKQCDSDWIKYITKEQNLFVYYTPSLLKEIEGANKAISKINHQTGLVDDRNLHLFSYLSKDRRASHNNTLLNEFTEAINE